MGLHEREIGIQHHGSAHFPTILDHLF
jgi:hypothetical protein